MSVTNQCCPICGKEYGLFDKIFQPTMCRACWKSGKRLVPNEQESAPARQEKNLKETGSEKPVYPVTPHTITLPRVWFGLLFVIVSFALILLIPGPDIVEEVRLVEKTLPDGGTTIVQETKDVTPPHPMFPYVATLLFLGWVYWFYCVYGMHKGITKMTAGSYPVPPKEAVGFNLIPIYNLFWVFKWTNTIAEFVNEAAAQKMKKGWAGVFLCAALIYLYLCLITPTRNILGIAVALMITLFVGMNVSRHIRKRVKESKKSESEQNK